MKRIKIVSAPPGFAPEEIRKEWIDIELPTEDAMDDGCGARSGHSNDGGYRVRPQDAIDALKLAGKTEAVNFWTPFANQRFFIFKKECCEEISIPA